eukprot:gene2165-biopygen1917
MGTSLPNSGNSSSSSEHRGSRGSRALAIGLPTAMNPCGRPSVVRHHREQFGGHLPLLVKIVVLVSFRTSFRLCSSSRAMSSATRHDACGTTSVKSSSPNAHPTGASESPWSTPSAVVTICACPSSSKKMWRDAWHKNVAIKAARACRNFSLCDAAVHAATARRTVEGTTIGRTLFFEPLRRGTTRPMARAA